MKLEFKTSLVLNNVFAIKQHLKKIKIKFHLKCTHATCFSFKTIGIKGLYIKINIFIITNEKLWLVIKTLTSLWEVLSSNFNKFRNSLSKKIWQFLFFKWF
jgi:hypothetical protein